MPPITPITVSTQGNDGAVTLTAQNLPAGLVFTDNGNGTGDITGTLASGTSGGSPYAVSITATDASGQSDVEVVTLTIDPAPREPVHAGLSDPSSPAPAAVGFRPSPNHYHLFGLSPDVVAMCQYINGSATNSAVTLVDISDAMNPAVLTTFNPGVVGNNTTGAITYGMAVDAPNSRVFIGGSTGLASYDISDPTTPVELEKVSSPTRVNGAPFDYNGTYLMHSSTANPSSSSLHIYDPDTLTQVGSFPTGHNVKGLLAKSDKVFVSDSNNGVVVQYRLNGGTAPQVWATYAGGTGGFTNREGGMAMLPGGTHFVALRDVWASSNKGDLVVYEVDVVEGSTGNVPVGAVNDVLQYSTLVQSDTAGMVYTLGGPSANDFNVFDCSDPTNPTLVSSITIPSSSVGLAVNNGKVVTLTASGHGLNTYT